MLLDLLPPGVDHVVPVALRIQIEGRDAIGSWIRMEAALEEHRLLVTPLVIDKDVWQDLLEPNQSGSISPDEGHDLSDALVVEEELVPSLGGYRSSEAAVGLGGVGKGCSVESPCSREKET